MNTPTKTPATIVQVIRKRTPTLTYIHPPPHTHTLLPKVPNNIKLSIQSNKSELYVVNPSMIATTTGMCTHTDLSLTSMVCFLQETHNL